MRIALNGYGRIGRSFMRALVEREQAQGSLTGLDVVAINDLGRAEDLLYLTRYDSTHGPFPGDVSLSQGTLQIGRHRPALQSQAQPDQLPWKEMNVDLVLECTGEFRGHADASRHLSAGARRVLVGAVPFDRADAVLVFGVNEDTLAAEHQVLSAASCTTHCITPLLQLMNEEYGVEQALMKEVHAYTSDQNLLDHVHRDVRRGRAAAQNIVPTTSSAIGAAQAVLPWLDGRISGDSIRVPTLNVAMLDLNLSLKRTPTVEELNAFMQAQSKQTPWLIGYTDEPLVSSDFNRRPESAVFDATQTRIQGNLVHMVAWYDNEWGYANRLIDLLAYMASE